MNATTFNALRAGLLAAAAWGLSACSGDGSREQGIEIAIKATPLATAHRHEGEQEGDSHTTFRRSDGMRIDLQLGLVNLVPVELEACPLSAAAKLLDYAQRLNPIGNALAHGSDGGEAPEGAVSVLGGEDSGLGTLSAAPGRYCALIVELQPGAAAKAVAAKHGGELDTGMEGASINVAPCYYEGTVGLSDHDAAAATEHHCIQAKVTGAARRIRLPLVTPVTLDAARRELSLTVAVRFEEWFEGVDFATLAGSAAEQARLADNVAASLQAVSDAEQLVNLAFRLKVGGAEATCGQVYEGLGNTAQPLRLQGLRFYASDFALENASGSVPVALASKPNGTVYQDTAHGVALLGHVQGCDGAVPLRNLALSGSAPAGDYDRICFTLGVPFALNHSDVATAPSPLNVAALAWSWRSGRMFLRFDSLVAGSGGTSELTQNFFVHLGSTGCSNGAGDLGAPPDGECEYPNRRRICLSYAPIAEGHAIVADIAPVISELDITVNTPDTAPGCLSDPGDPECATILPQLGLDFALAPDKLIPRREQALFTVGE